MEQKKEQVSGKMERENKVEGNKIKKGIKVKTLILIMLMIVLILIIAIVMINLGVLDNKNNRLLQQKENVVTKNDNTNERPNKDTGINPATIPMTSLDKPMIYLYPKTETQVTVKLGNPEKLSCTYPKYDKAWKVTASPNGDLTEEKSGRKLYALYWEGKNITKEINMQEGYCIKGENTIAFLEEKLQVLGLNEREAEEFIIYWLPKMEQNAYNYIRFETIEEQEKAMPLEITPKPDTTIRIMMDWKALEKPIEVKEQPLKTPERKGFVAVEWGGTEF